MDWDNKPDSFTEPEDFEYVEPADSEETADAPAGAGNDVRPRPKRRFRRFMIWLTVIVMAVSACAFWLRYVNPYVIGSHERGYIVGMEYKGMIFKTWEGEMIARKALTDTVNVYSHSFLFSVDDAEVAKRLEQYCGTGRQVTVTYDRFMGALPWRGGQTCIVTSVEPAD